MSKREQKNPPLRVLITGAAGQIGYSLIPIVASGSVFGPSQRIILHLLDIEQAKKTLSGVVMELQDSVFPLLDSYVSTTDLKQAFTDVDVAILVGGFPRLAGMERKDLLARNSPIFISQGEALSQYSSPNVKVLVVANPANTNCLVAIQNSSKIPKQNFSCLTRLDMNRAKYQLAARLSVSSNDIRNVIIWGNHSNTLFPDYSHAQVSSTPIQKLSNSDQLTSEWNDKTFIPVVQQRGAKVIEQRGFGSAMSAAWAIGDHLRSWLVTGTQQGEYVSMGVISNGEYGITKDIVYSFPVTCQGGNYKIVEGLDISNFAKDQMKKTEKELLDEKQMIASMTKEEIAKQEAKTRTEKSRRKNIALSIATVTIASLAVALKFKRK